MIGALKRVLRWALGLAGVCVLLIALLLGALRVLLPLVPAFQQEIAHWTSESLGYPVEFARIEPDWGLGGPEFRLRGVRVLSERGGGPLLLADEILVGLSLWRLLPGRGLTPDRMSIAGARLSLQRLGPDRFSIQGRDPDHYPGGPARLLAFVPADIDVRDIWVEYEDPAREVRENFWLERLSMKISGGRIVLDGRVVLPAVYGEWLGVGADIEFGQWTRTLPPSGAWKLHLEGRSVDLGRMRALAEEASALPVSGSGDFSIFADMAGGEIEQLFGELELTGLQIAQDPSGSMFDRLSGQFEWQREGPRQSLSVDRIGVSRGGRTWPETALSAHWTTGAAGGLTGIRLEAPFLRLEDARPLVDALASEFAGLAALQPRRGDVRELTLEWTLAGGPRMQAEFSGLGIRWPGNGLEVNGMQGRLTVEPERGQAVIAMPAPGGLAAPWLAQAAVLDELQADLRWQEHPESWVLEAADVRLSAAGMDWAGRFSLALPGGEGSPVLDLSGSGERIDDLPGVLRLLPWKDTPGLPFGWLGKALHSGRAQRWSLELGGPPESLPFGGGLMRVEMDFRDAVLTLHHDWPDARGLAGRMVIHGPTLTIEEAEGHLAGVKWRGVEVAVSDLVRPVVEVSATSDDPVPRLIEGLRRSPVAERIHAAVLEARTSGAASTRFAFRLPIKDRSAWWMRSETVMSGAEFQISDLIPPVTDLRGAITVTRPGVFADDLQGEFLGQPLTMRVGSAPADAEGYNYRLEMQGATSAAGLRELFACCSLDRLSGTFAWSAEVLAPSADVKPARPLRARLETDLAGFASTFPHPAGKSADLAAPSWLELRWGAEQPPFLDGRLGAGPGIAMRFSDHTPGWRIDRARLHFGDSPAQLPAYAGLLVDGEVDWLRPGDWATLFAGQADAPELPWVMDLDVGALYALSSEFTDQRLRVSPRADGWQVELGGEFAEGRLLWPRPGVEGARLLADLGRLRLIRPDPSPPAVADPRGFPAGKILIDDLQIGEMRLGQVRGRYQRTAGGLGVDWFRAESPFSSAQGSAAWLVSDDEGAQHLGRLDMVMESTDVAAALEQLGYARAISGDRGRMALSASWDGPPAGDFLTRANGTVSLEVESGDVPALDPGGGRMLGVLSLARLPRRLALDFREMTEEGLPFDRLAGDFTLRAGQAYTCNVGLQGAVAGLALFGRTGLEDRTYDQVAVVSPNLPDLLSLGGVIIGGTGLGATMLLLSQAFREPLQAISANYYRVSGSWEDPLVERVLREGIDLDAFGDCARYLEDNIEDLPDVDWDSLMRQIEEDMHEDSPVAADPSDDETVAP